jgi:hypothetical protein
MAHCTWRALGQAALTYMAIGGCAVRAQDDQPGREAFAEMIAFARLASVACERLAPDADGFHALALLTLIKPPLTGEEIVGREKYVQQLRDRFGLREVGFSGSRRGCRWRGGDPQKSPCQSGAVHT